MVVAKTGENHRSRLIVFDVEGVLLPKRRYLLFEAARKLSLWEFIKIAIIGFLYESGLISLENALRTIYRNFRGLTISDLFEPYKTIPLISGVELLFKKLSQAGYRTALISSGLPELFVKDLATKLNANYAFGLTLKTESDRLTGEIGGEAIKPGGKALILKRILKRENLTAEDCVVVADDRNNLQMFPLCTLKIGYNPDFILTARSDHVVKENLSEILPIIKGEAVALSQSGLLKGEIIREAIHIGSISIPLACAYTFLEPTVVSLLVLLVALLYTASEFGRMRGMNFPIFSTVTRRAALRPELHEFASSPIFFALGIALSLLLFPIPINYASVAVLTVGDGFARMFGRTFGRTAFPFNKGKRVEGSIFGFLLAFLGAMLFVDPIKALAAAAAGMFVESLPLPVNDNLAIPIMSGIAIMIMS
ncbi:MAG: haloacid dehalogenase-like hydrolase [Candidatus Bathyarchaeota archaeon]|nr:MAG: haloacid dehalogenase-like hydrolase [Candidatus Bathyarchaeota archaeon]